MANDDFDFDGMDWPDMDFGETQEPKDDRSPVSKVAKQAVRGAAKGVANEAAIRRNVGKVLPKGHSDAAEAAFQVKDLLGDTYSNIAGEAGKTKQELQRSLRNFKRQTKGLFADDSFIAKALNKLGGEDPSLYGRESDEDRKARAVDATLLEVFGAQEEARNEEKKEGAAKALRNEVISQRRFGTQLQVLASIDKGIRRVTDHNDVNMRFMRQQLKLQLQGNMMQADLIEQVGLLHKSMTEELKAVVKNTGLPEASKINLSEDFKRVNTQRAMEKIGGRVFGGMSDYLTSTGANLSKRVTNSIGGKLRDIRGNVAGGMDAVGDMIRMQMDARADGGEDDTIETILELASGIMMDKASSKWGDKIKSRLGKTKLFGRSEGTVDDWMTQGARKLNFEAGRRGTHDGLKGDALDFFRSLLDRTTLNSSTRGFTGLGDLDHDDPKMKRRGLMTVIKIIPGLLARIHHEAVISRTGDTSVPMIRYNPDTGLFTDSRSATAAVREKLFGQNGAQVNNEAMDRTLENIVDTKGLTGGQKQMLRNHIAHLNMRQLSFDPKAIATGQMQIFGEGSPEDRSAIRKLIGDQYGVNRHGEVEGDNNSYRQRVANSAKSVQSLRYNLKDPRKEILEMIEEGNTEELVAMGILKEQHGQLVIDFDRVNQMRFDDSAGADASAKRGAYSTDAFRPGGKGGKTINNILNSSTSTVSNTMTSIRGMGGKLGGYGKEDRYNDQYQSMALEEIIDVLKEGQTLSQKNMDALNTTISAMNQDPQGERYNAEYQTAVLEEIMDILQDGRQFANIGEGGGQPGFIQRGKNAFGRLKGKVKGKLSGIKDMFKNNSIMGMASGLKNKIMGRFAKNKSWAKDKYTSIKDKVTDRFKDVQDWYKTGEWRPALEARKLAAKKYIDEKTGKVVEKLSSVKGNILELMEDGSTQIALYYEDMMDGIRTMGGKQYFAKKLTGVMNWVDGKLGNPIARLRSFKDKILAGPKAAMKWANGKLFPLPDVYVKGEIKPRLLAVLAKGGNYITNGGVKVRTMSDITGPVADLVGNVLLDEDAIALGLVDADGNDLTKFAPGLKGMLQRVMAAPGAIVSKVKGMFSLKGIGRKIKKAKVRMRRAFRGFGKLLGGLSGGIMGGLRSAWNSLSGGGENTEEEHLNVAYAQLEVQGQILDQIVAQRKKKKRGKWDSDGSGFIDGSWRDLLMQRKKKKEEGKATDSGEKKESIWSKLKGWIGTGVGMLVTAVTSLGGLLMSGLSTLAGVLMGKQALGAFGDLLDRATGGRNRSRRPSRRRPGTRRSPGRAPRGGGKWGKLIAGASMLGFGGMAFAGDGGGEEGDGLNALDMADGLNRTKPSSTPKPKMNLSNSRSMLRVGTTAIRSGGWRALMNPYVLGGAAVVGGYLYYDASKKRPLRDARLVQYGVNLSDEDQADRYLEFESWMLEQGESVKGEQAYAAMEEIIGGVHNNSQKSLNWYANRFLPVFTKWQQMAKTYEKLKSFKDLDDVMTTSQAYTGYMSLKGIIDDVRGVPLAGKDKLLGGAAAISKLAEIEEILKKAAGGVEEGAGDTGSILSAGFSQAAGMMKGDKEMMGGTLGKLAGFGMTINPMGFMTKSITGFVDGAMTQYRSSKAVGNFDKIKITEGPIDALRAVRMKVYGLTNLDLSLVNALLKLEASLIADFTYSGKSTAIYRGKSQSAMEAAAAQLGVNVKDPAQMGAFSDWFTHRFLPSFTAYLGGAKEAGIGDPLLAHKTGTASQQYHAANAMVGTTTWMRGESLSVWKTGLSPLPGRAPNGDPSSVTGNMESLLAKSSTKELSEISGEKGGIVSGIQKAASNFMDKLSGIKNNLIKGATSWMPEGVGGKIRSFFGADGPSMGGGTTPTLSSPTMNQPGGSYTPSLGGGATVNFDPAGGKYGNVNDIPMPTGPKGFEEHIDLIKAVAEMTGVDGGVLAGLFATESGFDSRAVPGTSSAKGIGQFTTGKDGKSGTWAEMVGKYGHLFGIKEGTSPNDPRANALMTVMYMQQNAKEIRKFKKDGTVTDVDLYLAHFLGGGGYKQFYKNPNSYGATLQPTFARSNPSIFYVGGDRSRPRTAAEIMQIQANKQIKNRNHYGPLMHQYIKEKGGKVDESLFTGGGGVGVNTENMGGTVQQPAVAAKEETAGQADMNKPSPSGFTPDMLKVSAGGVPTGDGAVKPATAASAVKAVAQAGADIAQAPSGGGGGGGFSPVKQDAVTPQAMPTIKLDQTAPKELVALGTDTNSILSSISSGIDALVKQAGLQAQQRQVSARSSGPMSVAKPSSA